MPGYCMKANSNRGKSAAVKELQNPHHDNSVIGLRFYNLSQLTVSPRSYERQFFKRYLRKTGKKVDNQLKMIQKGLLLSCSYSRSVKLLPEATHDKCPSRCLNLSVNLFNDIGDIRFALHPRSSRLDKKQFLQSIFFADEFSFVIISSA